MEKQQSNEKVYFIKVTSDEETKKKKKYNINNNNIHKSNQKNTQNTFFKKKTNIENNNIEKYKSKKSSAQINEDSSPTKETMNSPSHNNNNFNSSQNDKDKEKIKAYIKQDIIKETPKKKKFTNEKYNYENDNKDNKSKNKEFDTIESLKKIENEDDLVTSFERKPSELKSPHTISEDSFTSSIYEEEKSKANKNDYQKNEGTNNDLIKRDNHTYSELVDNELIYVDKIK